MFGSKTVFVVGAGASSELNLPLGDSLTVKIAQALSLRGGRPYFDPVSDDRFANFSSALAILKRDSDIHSNVYVNAASEVQDAMPVVSSIDAYLHSRRDKKLVVQMGKLGIAWAIAKAEADSFLSTKKYFDDELRITWHRRLLNALTAEVSEGEMGEMFRNVSFIVFNYDRCLEHYLYKALHTIYPTLGVDALANALNSATFLHPYGVIGRLPWQPVGKVQLEFGQLPSGSQLLESANSLRIFTEGVDDKGLRDGMEEALVNANRCVFLGFAFHKQNMELLRIKVRGSLSEIIGTSFGAAPSDTKVFQNRVRKSFALTDNHPVDLHAMKCDALFSAYSQTIAE